jgi:catechol 2,3-dioxygenase-like lactoylglutathione lyase family enzyme
MGVRKMDHVGIIVRELDPSVAFFTALGLTAEKPMTVEGAFAGQVNGLPGSSAEIVALRTSDGETWLELTRFVSPVDDLAPELAPSNRLGIRHFALVVDDLDAAVAAVRELGYDLVAELVDYEGIYRLCYVRGPEEIIVELAQELR